MTNKQPGELNPTGYSGYSYTIMTLRISAYHPNKVSAIFLVGITLLFLSGCNRDQPVVYKIPKEERHSRSPVVTENNSASANDPEKMQILPGMEEAARAAAEIKYQVPDNWKKLTASGIRKATFSVSDDTVSAEVSVLTFPGDVGGTLANINRWREQIGLESATLESCTDFTESYTIANHEGLFVILKGETQSILGALLPFHGNTWFFKMFGDTSVVLANEESMKEFLKSVSFVKHAH